MAAKRLTLSCCVTLSPLILCKNESMFGHFTTLCMKGLNVFRSQARNQREEERRALLPLLARRKRCPDFTKKKHEAFIEVPLFQETFLALKNSWFRAQFSKFNVQPAKISVGLPLCILPLIIKSFWLHKSHTSGSTADLFKIYRFHF